MVASSLEQSHESHATRHTESHSHLHNEVHTALHHESGAHAHQASAGHSEHLVSQGHLPGLTLHESGHVQLASLQTDGSATRHLASAQTDNGPTAAQKSVADTTVALSGQQEWNKGSGLGSPDLGCAASVSAVLRQAGVYNGNQDGVYGLDQDLQSQGWQKANTAQPGDVIAGYRVSNPADSGGAGAHVGIVGADGHVYSNDSSTGRWTDDGTVQDFVKNEGFVSVDVLRAPGGKAVDGTAIAQNSSGAGAPAGGSDTGAGGGGGGGTRGGEGTVTRASYTSGGGGGGFEGGGGGGGGSGGGFDGGSSGSSGGGSAGSDSSFVPSAGSLSPGEQATAQELMNILINQYHMSPAGAAAVIGNFEQENGLSTAENAGGLGLAQWIGARADAEKAFAAQNGLSPTSKEAELGFMMKELSTQYPGLLNELKTTNNAQQAALDFSQQYERPGDPMNNKREGYAQAALTNYDSNGGTRMA